MLRRFPFLRRLPMTSRSSRQLRYVLFVAVLFFLIEYLPQRRGVTRDLTKLEQEVASRNGPFFHIQFPFEKEQSDAKNIRLGRQQKVKEAFLHAWKGYKDHAWLHDELLPISGGKKDPYVGWAATLVDGLDALLILGLHDEFDHALKALDSIDFTKPNSERVPIFETTIRYLGGLLGAYDVSGGKYPKLLEKADELGEFLFRAFATPNGIPVPYYWWNDTDKALEGEDGVLVAQIGSLSLEFTRLAQLTGKRKYFDGVSKVMSYLDKAQNKTQIPGLWPSQVDTREPSFGGNAFTLGAWADSLYEYLPKQHILLGGESDQYLRMYRVAMRSADKYHFFRAQTPGNQDLLFIGDAQKFDGEPAVLPSVQHLGCFVGGMVGLGAKINRSPEELEKAIRLTNSCVWAYQNTATGVMPEIFSVEKCPVPAAGSCDWTDEKATEPGHSYGFKTISDHSYQLRPEAIESVFVMYRLTGDPAWQEKGWDMFQAIMKHTTTPTANAGLQDVTQKKPEQVDQMESFWLAETLKYFFLLYSEPDVVSLDDFVLSQYRGTPFPAKR
ncbi:hypothetical protein HYFRA_00001374 [Hymenoscyphus fraxineus]|uniref:alpha-1,2-Mannosidase n=1 Tax=Hymenoscyphus fraxineus TaxID=746836 RepID=A0A9N9L6K5_9HELO|nr:hypothetical protein HYFRA_00001374 [Hymenoscyphus fraxineus]